jgi:hypothetical protein
MAQRRRYGAGYDDNTPRIQDRRGSGQAYYNDNGPRAGPSSRPDNRRKCHHINYFMRLIHTIMV